ncbi:MAG: four helix bundle protein, partial [Nitrospirae bacterium]|nr:four helix bundle protein [Nitrospirota bacterium]
SQIRRAAVSLTANVAEGYGRFHFKENIQYCRIARGSAYELIDHLIACQDESYLGKNEAESLHQELLTFLRLLNGYIRSIGRAGNRQDGQ